MATLHLRNKLTPKLALKSVTRNEDKHCASYVCFGTFVLHVVCEVTLSVRDSFPFPFLIKVPMCQADLADVYPFFPRSRWRVLTVPSYAVPMNLAAGRLSSFLLKFIIRLSFPYNPSLLLISFSSAPPFV